MGLGSHLQLCGIRINATLIGEDVAWRPSTATLHEGATSPNLQNNKVRACPPPFRIESDPECRLHAYGLIINQMKGTHGTETDDDR